jgi:hypothetical protein
MNTMELYDEFINIISKNYTKYDVFKFVILNLDDIDFIEFVYPNNNSWKIIEDIRHCISFAYIPENYHIAYKKIENKYQHNDMWKVITCGYYYDNNVLVPDNRIYKSSINYYDNNVLVPDNLIYKSSINYYKMSDSKSNYLVSYEYIFN